MRCIKLKDATRGHDIVTKCTAENATVPLPRNKEENTQLAAVLLKLKPVRPHFWIRAQRFYDCMDVWQDLVTNKILDFTQWIAGHPHHPWFQNVLLMADYASEGWHEMNVDSTYPLACIDNDEFEVKSTGASLGCDLQNLTLSCEMDKLNFTLNNCYEGDIYAQSTDDPFLLIPTFRSCSKMSFTLNSTDPR